MRSGPSHLVDKLKRCWLALALLGWQAAADSPPAQDAAAPATLPAGPTLVFGSETYEYDAKPEERSAPFTIQVTNVWTNSIVIDSVYASCHCTVATLPASPWILAPGASGAVSARVDLAGQEGTVIKLLTFFTSVGERMVTLKVVIPEPPRPGGAPLSAAERQAAMLKAAADPRAIFQGDCAACHVDKARGLLGKDLYLAACGICHDSPHRAGAVPDLRALKQPAGYDYWKSIITFGKPHTLMPAFSRAQGGPLTETQVLSLAAYLSQAIPAKAAPR